MNRKAFIVGIICAMVLCGCGGCGKDDDHVSKQMQEDYDSLMKDEDFKKMTEDEDFQKFVDEQKHIYDDDDDDENYATVEYYDVDNEPVEPTKYTVPDCVGLTVSEAGEVLEKAGITAIATYVKKDNVEKDIVISQDTAPGTIIEATSVIKLEISSGK